MHTTLGALALVAALALWVAAPAAAAAPPCRPCGGIRTDDPLAASERLAEPPRLSEEARLYLSYPAELDGSADEKLARRIVAAGGVPWIVLRFRTASPLLENLSQLEQELRQAGALARAAGPQAHFQVAWLASEEAPASPEPAQYAFLLKRASVTLTGAQDKARVLTAALAPDPGLLQAIYSHDVSAYLDGVALEPGTPQQLQAAVEAVHRLDPGRPVVLDGAAWPDDPYSVLAQAARWSEAGFALTLFDLAAPEEADLDPLKALAQEFQGDLSYDPYSVPSGGEAAWTFVRGSDLGLRVIVVTPPGTQELALRFPDPQLKEPARLDVESGELIPLYGTRRSAEALEVRVFDPDPVTVLHLERMTAEELEGIAGLEEKVQVTGERTMPVEEILRRLQAFEDAQARRLDHYRAINTTHLRFRLGGVQSLNTTFVGEYFVRQDEGFDWVWREFLINGVQWKGKSIPELPLLQPEKAASLPLEIHFTQQYRYRLRGTAEVRDRSCWVVDFEPIDPGKEQGLHQGSVWIDREIYGRVKSRAVQLNLQGEVISNEETVHYTPLDAQGQATAWGAGAFWLPTRVVGQQIWSILNSSVLVERETLLTEISINDEGFDQARKEALVSDVTMVRDTPEGWRYLVKTDEPGERVVKSGLKRDRLFGAAGVFVDESFDFPIPLAGLNYFSFDFKGTGAQANVFFAGPLVIGSLADPDFLGSRFDVGADLLLRAIRGTDSFFRDNVEVDAEDVEQLGQRISLTVGRAIGSFTKLNLNYSLAFNDFGRADDTAPEFVLPVDHFVNTFEIEGSYRRRGYRLNTQVSYSRRSRWEPWGLPSLSDFDPDQRDYIRWGASLSKNFYLGPFEKIAAELEYVDGSDLDRFSKFGFGFFSGIRVHGYQSDRVRAEEALAAHASYGLEFGKLFQLQVVGDGAWATDRLAGFDDEFLGGVGVVGNLVGPWQTLINVDLGAAVAGPDDGVVIFIAFLKLLR